MKIKFEAWSMLGMKSIEEENGKLIVLEQKRGGKNLDKEIEINDKIENLFYEKFSELGVWKWVKNFDKFVEGEPLSDGLSWSLIAIIKDKKVKSFGNSTCPKSYNELIDFFQKICGISDCEIIKYNEEDEIDIVDGY